MGPPRFELGLPAPRAGMIVQATLRPQSNITEKRTRIYSFLFMMTIKQPNQDT